MNSEEISEFFVMRYCQIQTGEGRGHGDESFSVRWRVGFPEQVTWNEDGFSLSPLGDVYPSDSEW